MTLNTEEKHDLELLEAVNNCRVRELEQQYFERLKAGTLSEEEGLEILRKEFLEVKPLEQLNTKIEKSLERKKRRYKVYSLNVRVGINRTSEFGDLIPSHLESPELYYLKNEEREEASNKLNNALMQISETDKQIILAYRDLGFSPEKENWTELARFLKSKNIKMSDKTAKAHFKRAQNLLQSLLQ